jgi:tetratricopeptide (TPR) repeat protein
MKKPKWRGFLLPIAVAIVVGYLLIPAHLATRSSNLPLLPPDLAEAYYNRGVAKFELGDKQGAIADFVGGASPLENRVIAINPQDAEAYSNRGVVKLTLGDKQGAIADLTKGAELFRQQGKMADYEKIIKLIRQEI